MGRWRERIDWNYSLVNELSQYYKEYPNEPSKIAELMGIKRSIIVNAIGRFLRKGTVAYKRRVG